MKVSYNWLNSFFDNTLPPPEEVVHELTFHAWEVEDVLQVADDTVFEVKVLPDRAHHALSHRGIAKDLSVILKKPLSRDPLTSRFAEKSFAPSLEVKVESATCSRYQAAVIEGVTIGPSPEWLQARLSALGQRPINNIVDATNYVMFDIGQPLHAFDAGKLGQQDGVHAITVRTAHAEERITTLTGEEYALSENGLLIVDGVHDTPIGIAGIKGGKRAEVDTTTTNIIIESANFNPVATRKSSQRLKLRTEASNRFENGIVAGVTDPALHEVVELILKVAGGTFAGLAETRYEVPPSVPVSVSLSKVERVLGVAFDASTARDIMDRFGYPYALADEVLTVMPPMERTDLTIPEDLIEELARIYGYDHVRSITPEPVAVVEVNKRFYYSALVRTALAKLGFSEVYTSSFREKDVVKLKNALATDKGYLRSSLRENVYDSLLRNVPNRDLLGLPSISIFEIGTVFSESKESYSLALGVRHGMDYREKTDKKRLDDACATVGKALQVPLEWTIQDGIAELDFGALLEKLPDPTHYPTPEPMPIPLFTSYSSYPAMSRDIAFWTQGTVLVDDVAELIRTHAGELLVRLTLFDEFSKDGRTSYAFRLVFQSPERTLTDEVVQSSMEAITKALTERGYTVR